MSIERPWTAVWDKEGRRILLVAGRDPKTRHNNCPIERDVEASVDAVYDVWRYRDRHGPREVVFVEIHLNDDNTPRGFPRTLLDGEVLGSQTLWPDPRSFMWWVEPD